MTGARFNALFGSPPRQPESPITQREMDLAASIQSVSEEILMGMARHVHRETGKTNLCLAGGVALNCVANGRMLREGPFDEIWIQPAAGDAGGALGVALFIWHQLLDKPRHVEANDSQQGSRLGPEFRDDEIASFLDAAGAAHQHFADEQQLCDQVAELLAKGHVVGWMQGRMEFGPRALGSRSILGDARDPQMQTLMNLKIKFRESFRPFAPSVLQDRVHEYFEMRNGEPSPYMLLVAPVCRDRRVGCTDTSSDGAGLAKRSVVRSEIPAVTHVDFSARVQTVDRQRNNLYHKLLKTFERKTGCPVIINTSFNVRGEPIVCSPAEAYRCFLATNMDVLVMGSYLLLKSQQPNAPPHEIDTYLASFDLD
jgi:carbamoyltransferase